MPSKVFICYYDFNQTKNTCKWLLTTDEVFANQSGQEYGLASLDDLNDWAAAAGQVFDQRIITVIEGNCKWVESKSIDYCGKTNWQCGYEIVWDE